MFVKLIIIACSLSAVIARYRGPLAGGLPASQYPAGLNPSACPNFPYCRNSAVAVVQVPEQTYVIPQFQFRPAATNQRKPTVSQYRPQQHRSLQVNQYRVPQQYPTAPENQYTPEQQRALDRGEYIGDGDYHGEGLAEALAPGYSDQHQTYKPGPVFKFHVHPIQDSAPTNTKPCSTFPYCQ